MTVLDLACLLRNFYVTSFFDIHDTGSRSYVEAGWVVVHQMGSISNMANFHGFRHLDFFNSTPDWLLGPQNQLGHKFSHVDKIWFSDWSRAILMRC